MQIPAADIGSSITNIINPNRLKRILIVDDDEPI